MLIEPTDQKINVQPFSFREDDDAGSNGGEPPGEESRQSLKKPEEIEEYYKTLV